MEEESEKEHICVCVCVCNRIIAVYLKLTHHGKATIL